MGKLVLFLCLALAIASAPSAQAGILDKVGNKFESIQKDVAQKVNDAIAKVEEVMAEAKDALMKILDRMQQTGNKMIESVVNQTSDIVNKVNDAIADAKAKGIDVAECAEKQAVLQKTVKDLTETTAKCVNKQVSDTKEDINKVFESASATIRDLNEILEKVMNCGTSLSCYLQCAAEASVKSVSGVADVAAKAYAVKTKVEERLVTMPVTCGQETLPRMFETITTNGKEAMECINSKLE